MDDTGRSFKEATGRSAWRLPGSFKIVIRSSHDPGTGAEVTLDSTAISRVALK